MTRICVVVTARPSWTKLQSICEALQAMPEVELQIVACASALLERYGNVSKVIEAQGFTITAECWSTYEGSNLVTSAKETGALLQELASQFKALRPDVVVVMADRHEVLAVAQAASYLHITCAHIQAGERTGSIDDRVRDAVTALSDVFFPCTDLAKWRVYGLTGSPDIFNFGCSSIDLAKRAQDDPPLRYADLGGAGDYLDLSRSFQIVLQHPSTDEADDAYMQMQTTLDALPDVPTICLWPGQDAGSEGMSKAIREYLTRADRPAVHTLRSLPPQRFLKLLTQASVLIGNSSAGIRESAFLGVPVVDIGSRQFGRQRAKNVVHAEHDVRAIRGAIQQQFGHGPYVSDPLYGVGDSGKQIAGVLADVGRTGTHSRPVRLQRDTRQKSTAIGRVDAG
jgi:UDP-hydrolysing UDP-N-acetyl-D-glucosamine 2-epimerase